MRRVAISYDGMTVWLCDRCGEAGNCRSEDYPHVPEATHGPRRCTPPRPDTSPARGIFQFLSSRWSKR